MEDEYLKLLDRAFEKAPELVTANIDFVIPKADSFIEGSKTIIKNIAVISDKARRNKSDIARYLSKELAASVNVDEQRLTISGKFSGDELDKRIRKYFETYVICKECGKPDTHLESSGRGMFQLVCEACGARYGVKSY